MELNTYTPPSTSQNPESEVSGSITTKPLLVNDNAIAQDEETLLYQRLARYPFDNDQEYQAGLAAILGHPNTPATVAEIQQNTDLVLQSKCFYFARKFGLNTPVDVAKYQEWLQKHSWDRDNTQSSQDAIVNPTTQTHSAGAPGAVRSTSTEQTEPTTVPSNPATTASATDPSPQSEPPPYPTSFAHIVDLITQNKPIPGIEEIPSTVLDRGSSKQDHTPRRVKPWEQKPGEGSVSNVLRTEEIAPTAAREMQNAPTKSVEDQTGTTQPARQGVVRMLQPDGIADRGLVAED